jgi:nickel/cobalt exporter
MIDTGHGLHKLELHDHGHGDAHWRFRPERGKPWSAPEVTLVAERPEGQFQTFSFVERGGYVESVEPVAEPFDFMVRIQLGHGNHSHDFDVSFLKSAEGHDHLHEELRGLDVASDGYQDAHELAHANDIRRRFSDRNVTTWQIVVFGLTGGLIPCPAAITVLLICLQLREFTLGFAMVLCFSIGLAITLVAVGAAAALSVQHATKRWSWFSTVARRAPYFSGVLLIAVGLYVGWHGWTGIAESAILSAEIGS